MLLFSMLVAGCLADLILHFYSLEEEINDHHPRPIQIHRPTGNGIVDNSFERIDMYSGLK